VAYSASVADPGSALARSVTSDRAAGSLGSAAAEPVPPALEVLALDPELDRGWCDKSTFGDLNMRLGVRAFHNESARVSGAPKCG